MNPVSIQAFFDELSVMEKDAGVISDLGTKILRKAGPAARAVGRYMHKGWNTGGNATGRFQGWMGAGREAASGRAGKAFETVSSLGGLTRYLPVGPKSLTVGFGALGANNALKKEDPAGQGRSRTERIGSLIGGTAAGIAGGNMGILGSMATGIAGDYVGGRIGRAISKRKPPTQPAEVRPATPTAIGRFAKHAPVAMPLGG